MKAREIFRRRTGRVQFIVTLFEEPFFGARGMNMAGFKLEKHDFYISGFYCLEFGFWPVNLVININHREKKK